MTAVLSPMGVLMREEERASGRRCIQPGGATWFSTRDWHEDAVVAIGDGEVHIVAVIAKRPGNGAFRRMIDGIKAAGLRPVVVVPFPHMESILRRWGWIQTIKGSGFVSREEWREATP